MQNSLSCVFCCHKDTACNSASVYGNMLKHKSIPFRHQNQIHVERRSVKSAWSIRLGREKRKVTYRFLCSRARCRWELDWSSPCWRGTSCGPTWCCCGPIIWPRALATWCRPSLCLRPSPRWLSIRGVASPGRSCTWLRGMGGPLQSQGFEGKSLPLQ